MKNEYIISKSIAWQIEQSKGFVYIYDNKTDNYFKLEGLAKEIWILLCEKNKVGDIVNSLLEIYQLDSGEEIRKDIEEFIDDLLQNELIK